MAPKRRKKSGGTKSAAAPAASSSATANEMSSDNPLSGLLTNIQFIGKDKTRCAELLQALSDGKCQVLLAGSDSSMSNASNTNITAGDEPQNWDCYWILLATHVISNMVQQLQTTSGDSTAHFALVLSALCHSLATILYADKSKLDKTPHNVSTDASKAGRSALARAIMSVTMASTVVLETLGQIDMEGMDMSLIRRAVWAAATALDMVVHHAACKVPASSSGDGWNHALHWLLHDAMQLNVEHEEGLLVACEHVSRSLSKEEIACIASLGGNDVVSPTPSAGNKRRRATGRNSIDDRSSPSPIAIQFQSVMEQTQLSILIDGRVSSRRWASMALVWFVHGQKRILDFCDAVLSDEVYWNTILDCPAVIGLKDPPPPPPPPKTASKSKRGSAKKAAASADQTNNVLPPVHIPGNVSAVALVCRLLNVFSEAGTNCGSHAPAGGLDTYAARVLNPIGTAGKPRGRGAVENLTWTRPDVRDLACVVIYKIVQSHVACLRSNCTSPDTFGRVLVNDETEGFAASVPNGVTRPLRARFYPAVHKSLNSLCVAAAASGDESTNVSDSSKRLLGIASAFVLSSTNEIGNIVDAKLYGFAVGQLNDCLRMIVSDDDRTGAPRAMEADSEETKETRHARLIKVYNLDELIAVPSLSPPSFSKPSGKKRKKKGGISQASLVCTFGGVFPQASSTASLEMTNNDLLSLLIRAVQSTRHETAPPTAMYTELIEIVRCCCDLHEPTFEAATTVAIDDGNSKRKGKKRAVSAKSCQGRKRRKKSLKEASQVRGDDETAVGRRKPMSLKSARAGLAADALNTIRMMLLLVPTASSASHQRRELRGYLRETLTTEHICAVVGLGQMIYETLVESYLASQAQKKSTEHNTAESSFFSATRSGDFRPYEKLLWTAHIDLCQTIGRDLATRDSRTPPFVDLDGKLKVFHAVAASSARSIQSAEMSNAPERWPLSLPAAHHALVSFSLVNEPVPGKTDSSELFIAKSFASSICAGLRDLSSVANAEWYTPSFVVDGREAVAELGSVPLALRDARLFVLVVSRLPKEEQIRFLAYFVCEVSQCVEDIKSSVSSSALIKEDSDVSGYLARIVTVCFSLVAVVAAGSRHRNALVGLATSHHYSLPNLVARQEIASTQRMKSGDWYRSDTSFAGIFSCWDSPVIPDVADPMQFIAISDDIRSKLRSIYESSLALGFLSAAHDRGHLLFSAWNASGGSSCWEQDSATVSRNETSAVDEENAIRRLIDIREDVCLLYREVHGDEGLFPKSIITRVLTGRGDGKQPGQLKNKLASMMSKAEAIVDSILSTASCRDETYELPLATFALLEAVSAYIAFIVATHTRSIDDLLHRILSNTSRPDDEDSASEYDEEADEDRIDALMKLCEACAAFGAAPTHPDWLDATCYLRDGITANDAVQIAQRALICSEKLSSAAKAAHTMFLSSAMEVFFEKNASRAKTADLAVKLCLASQAGAEDGTGSGDESGADSAEQWADAVASFCRLENWQVKIFSQDFPCRNLTHAMDAFCRYSVQRIVGAFHIRNDSFDYCEPSIAESRALGEWELLLSEALLGSCIDIALPGELSEEPADNGMEAVFREKFYLAKRWSLVQAANASHLMPVSALLRFGMSRGVGRKRHPHLHPERTAAADGEVDAESTSLRICEHLSPSLPPTSIQANSVIGQTLATLAELSLDVTNLLKLPCAAVASNLLIDSKAFSHLESMEALRSTFDCIYIIRREVCEPEETSGHRSSSAGYILKQLVRYVLSHGDTNVADDSASPRHEGLYTFLGGRSLSFETLTGKQIEFTKVLPASKYQSWEWRKVQGQAIADIIGLISSKFVQVSAEIVSHISDVLKCLLRLDHDLASSSGRRRKATGLSSAVIRALNSQDSSYFRTMAQWIVCSPPTEAISDGVVLSSIGANLCAFVSYSVEAACASGRKSEELKGESFLLDSLLQSMDSWLVHKSPVPINVLSLLCLLGTKRGVLHIIGSRLLSSVAATSELQGAESMEAVERFFRFLRDLEELLSESADASSDLSEAPAVRKSSLGDGVGHTRSTQSSSAIPDACSFVLRTGFHQQHWYNCYTCNLVWDKGCCSLCALRCHQAQGHDVTYSRHSSFFCDCGGEAPSEDENRSPCKCLARIDAEEMRSLAEGQHWSVIDRPIESKSSNCIVSNDRDGDGDLFQVVLSVASSDLGRHSRSSLGKLRTESDYQSWTKSLFDTLRSFKMRDDSENKGELIPGRSEKGEEDAISSVMKEVRTLCFTGRSGKALELQSLGREVLAPIRGSVSGTFQLRMSNDASTDRAKRAALAKNGVRRSALVADRRGRMIVAEPSSLLFCAALPFVNVRYEDKSSEIPFSRGQMGILGSHSLEFPIVGMDLNLENECHLAVWGCSEASVVILDETCHKAEKVVELSFELEPDDGDYVVKCVWIPDSQTMLALVCGLFVKIFDIRLEEDGKVNSLASYTLAYDAMIRDAALVPVTSPGTEQESSSRAMRSSSATGLNVFLLLNTGLLLDLSLLFDESGMVTEEGDMYIESGEGADLPVGGVRLNSNQPSQAGATTQSLGEAASLTFLPMCRVLLYSCVSSPVLALLLDEAGRISGSFEMLPCVVKSDVLHNDGYNIHGPFSHFTELVCVQDDGERSFRIVCVGKSFRTHQPKLLCLDLNQEAVRVKELVWCTSAGHSGTTLASSVDGIATFSVPTLADAAVGNANLKRSDFFERTCLCAVMSNGSMVAFGEQIERGTRSPLSSKPPFPLTLFERLVNLSDSDALIFGSDRIGSSTELQAVKAKLSPHNSAYYMCPSRDGCTITISLPKQSGRSLDSILATAFANEKLDSQGQVDDNLSLLREMVRNNLVIVAVRLLVGSTTTEFIPKYVSIEGRRVWLQPDVKKHYDLPLTAEEIGLALRNGFVSLGIGPSFDSGNNPLLDAIEVYAARREQISHWLPLSLSEMCNIQPEDEVVSLTAMQVETPMKENSLTLIVVALTHIFQVLRTNLDVTSDALETIRCLVQSTALEDGGRTRKALATLLNYVEPNSSLRKRILDEGTLTGALIALRSANDVLNAALSESNSGFEMDIARNDIHLQTWNQIRKTMTSCLKVSTAIAGERPENYVAVLEDLVAGEQECSLAVVASSIFKKALKNEIKWWDLVPDMVELCLVESMLFPDRDKTFASFAILSELLRSPDDRLANECCESILFYWERRLSKSEPMMSYQCDCCSLFPIEGARYSLPDDDLLLGQDADIDLCGDCYALGKDFASRNRYDARINVRIRGKAVGTTKKLTCARLRQMERLPITSSSTVNEEDPPYVDVQSFSSVLFHDLVRLLVDRLKEKISDFSLSSFKSLLDLILDVIRKTCDDDTMLTRAMEFSEKLLACFPNLIATISSQEAHETAARSTLTICVQGVARLATLKRRALSDDHSLSNLDDFSVDDGPPAKSKEKTDPRFICDVHGVAAVRRRCSHGTQKNRRFYVCGMERKSRCNYFRWADAEEKRFLNSPDSAKCKYTDEIGRYIWRTLSKMVCEDGSSPLSVQLCELISDDAHDDVTGAFSLPADVMGKNEEVVSSTGTQRALPTLPSTYDERSAALDYLDGVFCSLEKRWGPSLVGEFIRTKVNATCEGDTTIFQSTLELLSHVAQDAANKVDDQQDSQASSGWIPLLCEVISSSRISHYRGLAKRVLKRLCGGKKAVYHCVRDHYVFATQFQKLLRGSKHPLRASLNIKEQARQCGIHWKTGEKTSFRQLSAGGLIGTNNLVPEDCVTVDLSKRIGCTLQHLEETASSRGENWRNFCSLAAFPNHPRNRKGGSVSDGLAVDEVESGLFAAPPIVCLMWIANVLSGENQIEVLRLIDIALSAQQGSQGARKHSPVALNATPSCNRDADAVKEYRALLGICTPSSLPEIILLQGDKALLADELYAFCVHFVISGKSSALRKLAGQVALKLCRHFEGEDFEWLFSGLVNRVLSDLSEVGSTSVEFFRLLESVAAKGESMSSQPLLSISRRVGGAFVAQMRFLCDVNPEPKNICVPLESSGSKLTSGTRYDFHSCVHCHRTQVTPCSGRATLGSRMQNDSNSNTPKRASPAITPAESDQDVVMLPEQIRPFARESLDACIDVSLSTDFAMYVQLKCRLALSDVHVTIGDPRGRYVKTIAFYFTPRPVSDPNILKSEEYADLWQRCATVSLPRGATRATCKLSSPVIAANLRIQYEELYERPGGSRAPDGTLLVHCPRCTRVVSNAHGVCGHCGEVAFQCRKCRHINYDRLDAFLCVECGYCSAGTFSFDLTCGAASNAVAIVDDDSYERSIKVLRVATKLHDELQITLNDRTQPSSKKRSLSVQKYGPALKRTFLGELPKVSKDNADADGGLSGRRVTGSSLADREHDLSGSSSGGDRARSLLRLAHQLRNESSSDRSIGGDLLSQALDSDLAGFISSDLDGSDPLSRLVASIQGRSRNASTGGGANAGPSHFSSGNARDNTQDTTEEGSEATAKAKSDECARLYQLMREAERECYELHQRIRAWKRLENDALADFGATESNSTPFSPSKCSICSGPLALQLLALFMSLFESNSDVVQTTVTQSFIRALFDESANLDRELFDAKRAAIVSLATKSEAASKIILEQLRLRLNGSRDAASAEIMGKIIAIDSPLGEDFVKLASQILASGY